MSFHPSSSAVVNWQAMIDMMGFSPPEEGMLQGSIKSSPLRLNQEASSEQRTIISQLYGRGVILPYLDISLRQLVSTGKVFLLGLHWVCSFPCVSSASPSKLAMSQSFSPRALPKFQNHIKWLGPQSFQHWKQWCPQLVSSHQWIWGLRCNIWYLLYIFQF